MSTDPSRPERAVAAAFGRVESRLGPETVERVGARLLREDSPYRSLWLRNSRVARSVEMAAWLTAKSESERFRPAPGMVETAGLAVQVAECLETPAAPRGVVAGYRARAWAALGNAQRLVGDLDGARWSFGKAAAYARETGGPAVLAEISLPLASLLFASGSVKEAVGLCEESLQVFEATGAEGLAAKAMVAQSAILPAPEAGPTVESITRGLDLAARALLRLDGDPLVTLCAAHNLGHALVVLGHSRNALACLRHIRPLHQRLAFEHGMMKVRYLEGVAAVDLGRYREGTTALRQARAEALKKAPEYLETAERALEIARRMARLTRERGLSPAERERRRSALAVRLRWAEYSPTFPPPGRPDPPPRS